MRVSSLGNPRLLWPGTGGAFSGFPATASVLVRKWRSFRLCHTLFVTAALSKHCHVLSRWPLDAPRQKKGCVSPVRSGPMIPSVGISRLLFPTPANELFSEAGPESRRSVPFRERELTPRPRAHAPSGRSHPSHPCTPPAVEASLYQGRLSSATTGVAGFARRGASGSHAGPKEGGIRFLGGEIGRGACAVRRAVGRTACDR